jgi:hypothetical protein
MFVRRILASSLRAASVRGASTSRIGVVAQVARLSTQPGTGNPKIVNSLPSTVEEIDVDEYIKPSNGNGNGRPTATASTPPAGSNPFAAAETVDASLEGSDWSKSYHGLSTQPFSKEIADLLQAPIDPLDIEMKPGD